MRILGIDPGYAIVGFGVVSYHGVDFTPWNTVQSPRKQAPGLPQD